MSSSIAEECLAGISRRDVSMVEKIAVLCREEENRSLLSVCVQPLVSLVESLSSSSSSSSDISLQEQSCRALANLCFEHANNRLECCVVAPHLVKLYRNNTRNDSVRRVCCGCLGNLLSECDEAGNKTWNKDVVMMLVEASDAGEVLAAKALRNVVTKDEWVQMSVEWGVLKSLAKWREEMVESLTQSQVLAVAMMQGWEDGVIEMAGKGWWDVVRAVVKWDEARTKARATNDALWNALSGDVRTIGWLSGEDAWRERIVGKVEWLCQVIQKAQEEEEKEKKDSKGKQDVNPNDDDDDEKERKKERSEDISSALMALGNAARTDDGVRSVMSSSACSLSLSRLSVGSLQEQHMSVGLLNNMMVPSFARLSLITQHTTLLPSLLHLLDHSLNAHVLMSCISIFRKVCSDVHCRPHVQHDTLLLALLNLLPKLHPEDHVRVALEASRVAALIAPWSQQPLPSSLTHALKMLSQCPYPLLRLECCRCAQTLGTQYLKNNEDVQDMLLQMINSKDDAPSRLAAAIAVREAVEGERKEKWREALKAMTQDTETQIDGVSLSKTASALLEAK